MGMVSKVDVLPAYLDRIGGEKRETMETYRFDFSVIAHHAAQGGSASPRRLPMATHALGLL
jgi:hypothetical protein